MRARFGLDATHRVLLLRVEGQFTEELVRSNQASIRKYATATGAQAAIFDLSGVAEFVLSTNFIKSLAKEEPSMSASHPLVIVAPSAHGFGLVPEPRRSDTATPAGGANHGRSIVGARRSIPALRTARLTRLSRLPAPMLTTSFIPGTSSPYAFIATQLNASSEPSETTPPPLTWRFGLLRRWHPESVVLYSVTHNPPAWTSWSRGWRQSRTACSGLLRCGLTRCHRMCTTKPKSTEPSSGSWMDNYARKIPKPLIA